MLKVLLIGAGNFPEPVFKNIINSSGFQVSGLVTSSTANKNDPTTKLALNNKIKIFHPEALNKEAHRILTETTPEIIIVCNYGQILGNRILEYPKYKCINIHASLLPELRGACPIEMAILRGKKKTGITFQIMEEELDSGDILFQKPVMIDLKETGGTLFNKLQKISAKEIVKVLEDWINGKLTPIKQNHKKATYCFREEVSKDAAKINWKNDAKLIERKIRAFNPYPIAWSFIKTSNWERRIKIIEASFVSEEKKSSPGEVFIDKKSVFIQCGKGGISPKIVQLEGKNAMNTEAFLNGIKSKFKFV